MNEIMAESTIGHQYDDVSIFDHIMAEDKEKKFFTELGHAAFAFGDHNLIDGNTEYKSDTIRYIIDKGIQYGLITDMNAYMKLDRMFNNGIGYADPTDRAAARILAAARVEAFEDVRSGKTLGQCIAENTNGRMTLPIPEDTGMFETIYGKMGDKDFFYHNDDARKIVLLAAGDERSVEESPFRNAAAGLVEENEKPTDKYRTNSEIMGDLIKKANAINKMVGDDSFGFEDKDKIKVISAVGNGQFDIDYKLPKYNKKTFGDLLSQMQYGDFNHDLMKEWDGGSGDVYRKELMSSLNIDTEAPAENTMDVLNSNCLSLRTNRIIDDIRNYKNNDGPSNKIEDMILPYEKMREELSFVKDRNETPLKDGQYIDNYVNDQLINVETMLNDECTKIEAFTDFYSKELRDGDIDGVLRNSSIKTYNAGVIPEGVKKRIIRIYERRCLTPSLYRQEPGDFL
jgi:hypothetical protein